MELFPTTNVLVSMLTRSPKFQMPLLTSISKLTQADVGEMDVLALYKHASAKSSDQTPLYWRGWGICVSVRLASVSETRREWMKDVVGQDARSNSGRR